MGKLGGQELNYSSDVDVLFVYSDEGRVFREAPTAENRRGRCLSNHQYFNRLAEAFIAEISRLHRRGCYFASTCDCVRRAMRDRFAVRWTVTKIIIRNGARRGSG